MTENMFLIHVLECEEFKDRSTPTGSEQAEIILDESESGDIHFTVSYYDIDGDGDRNAIDIRLFDAKKATIGRIVRLVSEWLDDDLKPSVSFSLGEFEANGGPRGNPSGISEVHLSINKRGIWFVNHEQDIEVRIPAGTKRVDGEYSNLYNINKFKELLERFLYGYGRDESQNYESLDTPVDDLDEELQDRCVPKFNRGEYADAAKTAGQILDERISESVDEVNADYGTALMQDAFNPDSGPLAMGEDSSEKRGVMFLYTGAIQGFRNPLSHRTPDSQRDRYLDQLGKREAHHIICYIDLLLSLVDQR